MQRSVYLVGWGYVAICAALLFRESSGTTRPPVTRAVRARSPAHTSEPPSAAQWFRRVKPYCNAVEVSVLQRQAPAPSTVDGVGYHAACFALAGHIDAARRLIDALPPGDRYMAAGIVFNVGHPVADAGDDRSAGPIMELVIDYWPNHYMALYHAGMAEYMVGQRALASRNLERFLDIYREPDGWRANAIDVLGRLRDPVQAERDLRRPREPDE